VWAIGDITGKGAFTHVAMYQAGVVLADILGWDHPPARYDALPRVTFTDPEVGAVGLTERQARERLAHVRVGSVAVPSTSRGTIQGPGNEGLIKLVADGERGVLVGATAMSAAGGEVLGALTVAVHAAVPLDTLRSMIYAYPTFHRGIEAALQSMSG
jgi:pyruvate/2-oxoglutarate dehydrogenase complex dihydrolipoamide dehydrogenase (E3) component